MSRVARRRPGSAIRFNAGRRLGIGYSATRWGRATLTTKAAGHRAARRAVLFLSARISEGIMIHHLSIAARDPKRAAATLAEIMGGRAVPFPPNPGSFFALQLDDHGSGVEVYPAGTELHPGGSEGGGFVKNPKDGRGFGASHFRLSVAPQLPAA